MGEAMHFRRALLLVVSALLVAGAGVSPALAADTFEPNNTPAMATPIVAVGNYVSYISTDNDQDFYRLYLEPGNIRIVMTTPGTYAGHLKLFDAAQAAEISGPEDAWTASALADKTASEDDAAKPLEMAYSITGPGYYYVWATSTHWILGSLAHYDASNPYSLLFEGQNIDKIPASANLVAPGRIDSGASAQLLVGLASGGASVSGKTLSVQTSLDGISGWTAVAVAQSESQLVAVEVTPPTTRWYRVSFAGDKVYRAANSTAYRIIVGSSGPLPGEKVTRPTSIALSGPSSVKVKKTLKLSGTVSPGGPGSVKITMTRLVGRKWKSARTGRANVVGGSYVYSFKPKNKGSWRIVASYSGGVDGNTTYLGSKSGYKSVKVK